MYKSNRYGGVIRLSDGAGIPASAGNPDWQAYLEWLDLGNTPQPADPEPPPDSQTSAKIGARAWYEAHPEFHAALTDSIAQIEARIDGWDLSALPAGTRGEIRATFKLLLIGFRVLAKREGFVE